MIGTVIFQANEGSRPKEKRWQQVQNRGAGRESETDYFSVHELGLLN